MRGMTQQVIFDRTEEADKDKKKKRRSNRRPNKHLNSSSSPGTVCSSSNGTHGEATALAENVTIATNVSTPLSSSLSQKCRLDNHPVKERELPRASNVGFSSLPTMHINEEATDLGSMQDHCQSPIVLKNTVFSKSCPDPIHYEETNGSLAFNINHPPSHEKKPGSDSRRSYFVPFWSADALNEAIQKGDVFIASFRVNTHNRLEAYCTIDGLPTDVLISGVAAQNRAVEGDVVAVKLDHFAFWTKLKGSAGHINNCTQLEGSNLHPKVCGVASDNCKGKEKVDYGSELHEYTTSLDPLKFDHGSSKAIGKMCALISSNPSKRPTGTVVAIIQKSLRRDAIVGFLSVTQWFSYREGCKKETKKKRNPISYSNEEFIQFIPNDARFPKMLVSLGNLPNYIKKRLTECDATLEMELLAARIDDWKEDSFLPHAHVMHSFGRGGEIEPQAAAILFEHAICRTEFSPESLSCLPEVSWEVPMEELGRRKDLRNLCTFTIDPSTAADLDDALSVERVSDNIFRVGVHIADVSYFVLPHSPLDIEAQTRSTSIYLRQHKIPMLPPLLSENIGSLVPGVERLAFSILFDCNLDGDVVDRWIGRTVIRSCCKLSYQHAQGIIDGLLDVGKNDDFVKRLPALYGQFGWEDVIGSVKNLYEISIRLKENRFKDGAIRLENSKPLFLLDEHGIPYDSMLSEQTESNYLVEEFMLLANRTVAEVISRAYPDCALLRRHPEPNGRKLKDFETFCRKHGLELETSSSSQFNSSLGKIKEKLKNDPVLFDILISFASRPMQLATYFCTGNFRDRETEWAHYALAMPLYTHFTSPLRRYADILVHRTLSAAIEAEEICFQQQKMTPESNKGEISRKCFSSLYFDHHVVGSDKCREALASAALKYRLPRMEMVTEMAAYCNEKRLASRHAEDAGEKLYLWALLKKKETLIAEARVLGLGPKFMSIYIHKLAIERRIYYDEVDGLTVEWLENTSSLVLSLCTNRRNSRRGSTCKFRPLEDVALVINPCDLEAEQTVYENDGNGVVATSEGESMVHNNHGPISTPGVLGINGIEPTFFPLTVRVLSTICVALHAIGGDDGPLDVGARLYTCSYLK